MPTCSGSLRHSREIPRYSTRSGSGQPCPKPDVRRLFAGAARGGAAGLSRQGGQPIAQAEFIKVQKFLGGISYPASSEQLVDHARGNEAGGDVLHALRSIPGREYDGPNEVSKAATK